MDLGIFTFASSSAGNCYPIRSETTNIMVDVGITGKAISSNLEFINLRAKRINAFLITHEHIDHIRGAGIFARKYSVPGYATQGTWLAMCDKLGEIPQENMRTIDPEQDFFIGNLSVQPFATPHDAAESVGYVISTSDGARFGLATDIGCVRTGWLNTIRGCAAVLLESNYDPDMLKAGKYPYDLKRRIMSRKGHLSNDDAAEVAISLIASGTTQIVLGHLSKENNFPELALTSCQTACARCGAEAEITVAKRDGNSGVYTVKSGFGW